MQKKPTFFKDYIPRILKHKYPIVTITIPHPIEVGTPILINVETSKYLTPTLLVNPIAVTFGNPLVGNPIAHEHINAVHITNKLG